MASCRTLIGKIAFGLRINGWIFTGLACCLLNCDTAICKTLQTEAVPDPFDEIVKENPDLFKPRLTGIENKPKKQEYVNPQELFEANPDASSQSNASERTQNAAEDTNPDDRLRKRIEELRTTKLNKNRPIYPERTKPGGPISSCSVEATMSAEQEAFLYSQLDYYDETSWQGWSITDLHGYLNNILPTYVNCEVIENEGVSSDRKIKADFLCPGPLHIRLETYFCHWD